MSESVRLTVSQTVSVSQGSPELLLNQALLTGASIDFEQTSPTYNYNKARSYWNWIRLWNYAQPPDVILEAGGSTGVQGGVGSDRSSLGLGTGNDAGRPRGQSLGTDCCRGFIWGLMPCSTHQGLLLALCSRIIPGRLRRPYRVSDISDIKCWLAICKANARPVLLSLQGGGGGVRSHPG